MKNPPLLDVDVIQSAFEVKWEKKVNYPKAWNQLPEAQMKQRLMEAWRFIIVNYGEALQEGGALDLEVIQSDLEKYSLRRYFETLGDFSNIIKSISKGTIIGTEPRTIHIDYMVLKKNEDG